jgi:hypothetical protein
MKTFVRATLCAACLIASTAAWSQDKAGDVTDMRALQKAVQVQADKRAYIAGRLKLNATEARKFWPLYDDYQRILEATNRRRVVVVERLIVPDKPISELYSKALASELLAADDAELKGRRTLQTRLMRALPPTKAARYLQLESKIRAIHAYTIAETIPLVD